MSEQYYSDTEIAALLGISLSRLRGKVYQGEPLPARIEIPGSRTRLWSKEDVHGWLDQFKKQGNY
jgi:predicted DNA-binding transcriptional regulator AlpA